MGSRKRSGAQDTPAADKLFESANQQDEEATQLADKAAELEAEGKLAEAKSLSRASRHRRVESLKVRALAAAKRAI